MSPASFPRMLFSEREGWTDIVQVHPSVRKLLRFLVIPMSLVPPLMYLFAQLAYPGRIFPISRPEPSLATLLTNGIVFFGVELAMVAFMAMVIRQIADGQGFRVPHENAYALAAIAPVPLWLAALALFVPSLGFNLVVLALAWVGSVALIRHGVPPLLGIQEPKKARYVANLITLSGIIAWFSLLIVAAGILSFLLVWWR